MRSFFSNTVTSWPARASCCAAARPAGPEPTTATFLPVLCVGGCGATQPSAQALSMIACSIDLMPTGSSLMLSVHAASHGAGQMRPVNSGKLLVECSTVERVLPVAAVDQVVEVRNDVVDRAAVVAERNAAVHAARALDLGVVVGQCEDEFLVVLDALGDGLRSASSQALELHENRLTLPMWFSLSLYLAADFGARLDRLGAVRALAIASSARVARISPSASSPSSRRSRPSARLYSVGNTLTNLTARLVPVVEQLARARLPGALEVTLDQRP